jgi:phosphoglycolate phosphatase
MKPILLFDIDGTLIHVKRLFLSDIIDQILDELNISKKIKMNISFAGRTDKDIFTQLADSYEGKENLFDKLKQSYVDAMLKNMNKNHVDVIPGAEQAVKYSRSIGVDIGLCTGNFKEVAYKKIEAAGLSEYFSFGGFGCNHVDRIHLPSDAHLSYSDFTKHEPHPSQYVIIGDTPNDIRCAKYFGARSVAVTTGSFSAEQLKPHNPDFIYPGLENPEEWIKLL